VIDVAIDDLQNIGFVDKTINKYEDGIKLFLACKCAIQNFKKDRNFLFYRKGIAKNEKIIKSLGYGPRTADDVRTNT